MSHERDREWVTAILAAKYANPQATTRAIDSAATAAMHDVAMAANEGRFGMLQRELQKELEP